MTVQAFNVGDELTQLIADGQISHQAISAITGIAPDSLGALLATGPGLSAGAAAASSDEVARLSALSVQLTQGAVIDDDERLRAIIETLVAQYQLSHENIALLTRTCLDDLTGFLNDPAAGSGDFKFHLAVRSYYLLHAFLNAAPVRQ